MADYANFVGYGSILLAFALLGFVKGNDPWRLSTLAVGIMLVALAALSFGMFTDMTDLFELLAKENKIDAASHSQAKAVAGVWAVVLSAVIGAIGANLITAWFMAKKPN